jgi:hypothetical protein
MGRIFIPSMAGKSKNEPPPATAFSIPARKEAAESQSQRQSIKGGRLETSVICL